MEQEQNELNFLQEKEKDALDADKLNLKILPYISMLKSTRYKAIFSN